MLRWLGPRKAQNFSNGHLAAERDGEVTDDPLAAIDQINLHRKQIYSVSRINPLFVDNYDGNLNKNRRKKVEKTSRQSSPRSAEKSSSSGYGGSSNNDPLYCEQLKLQEDAVAILEQNSAYVRSIRVAAKGEKNRSLPSTNSSGAGTLNAIPEGRIDFSIPRPIWPRFDGTFDRRKDDNYDSLVDEALLLYTNFNYIPTKLKSLNNEFSLKEILTDLLNNINDAMEGKSRFTPEEMLKYANERVAMSLEVLKYTAEEDMKKLCVNLSNNKKMNSVIRAFSNSSSSGHSSPSWNDKRVRTSSSDQEEIYQIPSASSSSGFSDTRQYEMANRLPVFVHEDLASVPNGVRNAMIYGTLCRYNANLKSGSERQFDKERTSKEKTPPKKSLLKAVNDNKPSVWEQYYGVCAVPKATGNYLPKPTDVPLFPGGRPEADFTLDMPRSELLSKKMKADKRWRCRCRLLTSFLGLVFFLLSVMAVSLMLTRGKRMFGSMV